MALIVLIEDLIQEYLGPDKNVVDVGYHEPEVPGGISPNKMLQVRVILIDSVTGERKQMDLLAKGREVIDSSWDFLKKEIIFFTTLLPAIRKFELKYNLTPTKLFQIPIGAKMNAIPGREVDNSALLMLVDLVKQDYKSIDRFVGFDFEGAKVILKDLATLHARGLAMKLLEREMYELEIVNNCVMPPSPIYPNRGGRTLNSQNKGAILALKEMVKTNKQFSQKVEMFLDKINPATYHKLPVEPFATLLHGDVWTNNTLQQFENGNPVDNKIIDFQFYHIGSPAVDLVYFLISSVQIGELRNNFHNLIGFYYECLSEDLMAAECFGPQFTFDNFMNELDRAGDEILEKCLFMIPFVIFANAGPSFYPLNTNNVIQPIAKDKIWFLLVEAENRRWI